MKSRCLEFVKKNRKRLLVSAGTLLITLSLVTGGVLVSKGSVFLPGEIYIPCRDDGEFLFIGTKENFVEYYQNPYQDEKVYIEFEYLGETEYSDEEKPNKPWEEVYSGMPAEEMEEEIIQTVDRKLEAVYYFVPLEPGEYSYKPEGEWIRDDERLIRVVLSEKEEEGKVYYYRLNSEEGCEYQYITDNMKKYFQMEWKEYFDILVDGKEIPAVYYYEASPFRSVKVKRYTHLRNCTAWEGKVRQF